MKKPLMVGIAVCRTRARDLDARFQRQGWSASTLRTFCRPPCASTVAKVYLKNSLEHSIDP